MLAFNAHDGSCSDMDLKYFATRLWVVPCFTRWNTMKVRLVADVEDAGVRATRQHVRRRVEAVGVDADAAVVREGPARRSLSVDGDRPKRVAVLVDEHLLTTAEVDPEPARVMRPRPGPAAEADLTVDPAYGAHSPEKALARSAPASGRAYSRRERSTGESGGDRSATTQCRNRDPSGHSFHAVSSRIQSDDKTRLARLATDTRYFR